jgi:hypothetical protein
MRRWLAAASAALAVADRPTAWLPGALAWLASVGWLPFLAAVVTFPNVGDLTAFGAGLATSGAWPLNLVALVGFLLLAVASAFILAALGTVAVRAGHSGDPITGAGVLRQLAVAVISGLPAVLAVAVVLVGAAAVAPAEVNRPGSDIDPITRIVGRVAPLIAFAGLLAVGGALLSAVAGREAARRHAAIEAIGAAPGGLRASGPAGAIHAAVTLGGGAVLLIVAWLLLDVLWAPIEVRLAGGGSDVVTALLLVGFVAIWLCLVLGGGAFHAWSTVTWSDLAQATPAAEPTASEAAWRP